MHLYNFLLKIKNYLTHFVLAHLLITLVSLPILICWGIPLSKLSIIGNFLFTPILTIFLVLSSIIFFTELFYIPNLFLIKSLETLTSFWQKLLVSGNKSWLTGFTKQNSIILLSIPAFLFLVFTCKKINSINKKIISMSILLILYTGYFSYQSWKNYPQKQTLFSFKNKLKITKKINGKLNIQDHGFFNKKRSIRKFIDFELKSYLLKNFGTIKIKNLSVLNPGINSFKAAQEFCKVFDVSQITLPIFDGKKLNKNGWREFFVLREVVKENGVKFVRS